MYLVMYYMYIGYFTRYIHRYYLQGLEVKSEQKLSFFF